MSPIAAQNPSDPHVQAQWAQMFLNVAIVRQKQGDLRAAVDLVARGRPCRVLTAVRRIAIVSERTDDSSQLS